MAEHIVDAIAEIDESARRPGYARVVVPDAGSAGQDARFRVRRLDREHENQLGPSGWQSGAADLMAWKTVVEESDLVLFIGPDVVDEIPNHINIEIEIPAAGVIGEVFWPDIPPSNVSRDQRAPAGPAQRPPPPSRLDNTLEKEARSPSDETVTPPVQEPEAEPPSTGNIADDTDAVRMPLGDDDAKGGRKNKPVIIGVAAALILAVAALGYYLLSMEREPTQESAGTGSTTEAPPLVPPEPQGPPCTQPYDYVNNVMSGRPNAPDAWFETAKTLISEDCDDAAALLLLEATEASPPSVPALVFMGRLADPLVETENRVLFDAPDPRSALSSYGLAAQHGSSEAGQARQRLIEHLREQAAGGDTEAQAVLDSIQQSGP